MRRGEGGSEATVRHCCSGSQFGGGGFARLCHFIPLAIQRSRSVLCEV